MANIGSDPIVTNAATNQYAALGRLLFQSVMTTTAASLGSSYYWPGSGGDASSSATSWGEPRPGSMRPARASTQSLVRSTMNDGALGIYTGSGESSQASNSVLYHIGSSLKAMLGHPKAVVLLSYQSNDEAAKATQTSNWSENVKWYIQSGFSQFGNAQAMSSFISTADASHTSFYVTFATQYGAPPPFVYVKGRATSADVNGVDLHIGVGSDSITSSGFSVQCFTLDTTGALNSGSEMGFQWVSIGTVPLTTGN